MRGNKFDPVLFFISLCIAILLWYYCNEIISFEGIVQKSKYIIDWEIVWR